MAKAGRDLRGLLSDLVRWGETVESVVVATSRDEIVKSQVADLALQRAVEVFGDICGRLQRAFPEWCGDHAPDELSNAYRLRNKLAHGYDQVRSDILFDIAGREVAALTSNARQWLSELERDDRP